MEIKIVGHADHGVSPETLAWAVAKIAPTGFFKETLLLPEGHADLVSKLYGPSEGDPPVKGVVMVRDVNDDYRGATPFVDLPPRPSRKLTIIGIVKDGAALIYTAYGGAAAERVPSDPSIADKPNEIEAARKFWSEHALSIAAKK